LKKDYGEIKGYRKPLDNFPNSIMNKSDTGGAGRGSDKGSIIGDVICHGKKKYWQKGKSYHYHLGLNKGENTLETCLTLLLMKGINEKKEFD